MLTILFNSATATQLEQKYASKFFNYLETKSSNDLIIIPPNKSIQDLHGGYQISFTQCMLCKKDPEKKSYSCIFFGDQIGRGGFSQVYDTVSITVSVEKKIEKKTIHPQVTKIQQHCPCPNDERVSSCSKIHFPTSSVNHEYTITSQAGYLNVSPPLINTYNNISYLTMDKITPGKELFAFIQRDVDAKNEEKISLDERMVLTKELFRAVREIQEKGIIHQDLKPENMILQLNPVRIKIIDFALGLLFAPGDKGVFNANSPGSMSYASPECLMSRKVDTPFLHTPKMDVFSLARILVLIWGGVDYSYSRPSAHQQQNYLYTNKHLENLDIFLFLGIKSFDLSLLTEFQLKPKLLKLLKSMLSISPEERVSIHEAESQFNEIYEEWELKQEKQIPTVRLAPSARFFHPYAKAQKETTAARIATQMIPKVIRKGVDVAKASAEMSLDQERVQCWAY